jgi:hypothetical protein
VEGTKNEWCFMDGIKVFNFGLNFLKFPKFRVSQWPPIESLYRSKEIRVNSSAAHRIAPKAQNQLPVSPPYKNPLETLNSQSKITLFQSQAVAAAASLALARERPWPRPPR